MAYITPDTYGYPRLTDTGFAVYPGQSVILRLETPVGSWDQPGGEQLGTLVPYTIEGVSSGDINGTPLTGNIEISSTRYGQITITANSVIPAEKTMVFKLTDNPTVSRSIQIFTNWALNGDAGATSPPVSAPASAPTPTTATFYQRIAASIETITSNFSQIANTLESINTSTSIMRNLSTDTGVRLVGPYDWSEKVYAYEWYIQQNNLPKADPNSIGTLSGVVSFIGDNFPVFK